MSETPVQALRFDVITLFADMFAAVSACGVTGRAWQQRKWLLELWNPRDFTEDVHRTVDDRPYGGGPGMVMRVEPLEKAVLAVLESRRQADYDSGVPVVLLSPQGRPFNQAMAQSMSVSEGAIFVCGRYEGIDQRFINKWVSAEVSVGDFVLSGGELACMAMIDASVRLLPGVLNDDLSAVQDSFHASLSGLLDCPHYTRPEVYDDMPVPAVLQSGHHANIARWRREQSLMASANKRPDLIERAREAGLLSPADERFLASLNGKASPGQ